MKTFNFVAVFDDSKKKESDCSVLHRSKFPFTLHCDSLHEFFF